jgi:hypothetical protein
MKLKTDVILKEINGEDMTRTVMGSDNKPKQETMDLKEALGIAVTNVANGEILPAEMKAKLFGIGVKVYSSKEVDLTESEKALLLERIDKLYPSPTIYGRIQELFDGKEQSIPVKVEDKTTDKPEIKNNQPA